jgi:hypothetical protein
MRSKAQTQAASRCLQRVFELDTGELDFVSVTPWQMCWFIAKVAVPSQRRLQGNAPLLQQRDHVLLMPRLFRNANSQESKQYPGEQRNGSGKEETPDLYKKDSG